MTNMSPKCCIVVSRRIIELVDRAPNLNGRVSMTDSVSVFCCHQSEKTHSIRRLLACVVCCLLAASSSCQTLVSSHRGKTDTIRSLGGVVFISGQCFVLCPLINGPYGQSWRRGRRGHGENFPEHFVNIVIIIIFRPF